MSTLHAVSVLCVSCDIQCFCTNLDVSVLCLSSLIEFVYNHYNGVITVM